ncbi:MAG: GNAT family N-acetyltransferase [bacterium]
MPPRQAAEPEIQQVLPGLFGPYPTLRMTRGDLGTFRRLRMLEPGLVSFNDGKPLAPGALFGVLAFHVRDEPAGVVSFGVQPNLKKKAERNRFARIDLVIVPPGWRGLGVGRLIVECAVSFLLQNFGGRLYSISSLAAHGAVAKVLEELGFVANERPELSYVHEELRLEEKDPAAVGAEVTKKTGETLRLVFYRLRQREAVR